MWDSSSPTRFQTSLEGRFLTTGPPGKTLHIYMFFNDISPYLKGLPGEGNDNQLQYFCLENSVDRGVSTDRWAAVHWVAPALEKEMATHSSILAWRISGTEEPDGLPSMGRTQSQT